MSEEKIKMTEGEVAEVRLLQEKFQQKVFQLGQLYLQKIQAEKAVKDVGIQETKVKDEWDNLQRMENELIDKLLKKYGEGSLDLSTGVFIVDKKAPSS